MQNIKIHNIQVHPENLLNETLLQMNYLEQLSLQSPSFIQFVGKNFYTNCMPCIPGKIWNYMRSHFKYVLDDPYDEKLTAPYLLVDTKKGDCDDFALFAKTCLNITGGWFTNYLLLGKTPEGFSHIVCFAHRGNRFGGFVDPVVIDGASELFNYVDPKYKYQRLIL